MTAPKIPNSPKLGNLGKPANRLPNAQTAQTPLGFGHFGQGDAQAGGDRSCPTAKTPDPRKARGRPSLYNPQLGELICDRIAAGESLVSICLDAEMPGLRTVMRWAAEYPDFGTEYARAREAQAEVMDHKITSTADDMADPVAAKVKISAYQWRAAKLAPKRYGERTTIAGDPEAPLIPALSNINHAETLAGILGVLMARRETAEREGLSGPLSREQFDYLTSKHPMPAPVPINTYRNGWQPPVLNAPDGSDLA